MEKNEEKNSQKQEYKGRNLEDAISLAEHMLKLPRNQISYEIVAEKSRLFGIGSKEIVILAGPKKAKEDYEASQFLDNILSHFPLEIKYHTKEKNGILHYIFEGPDKYLLLRKEGALLLAFQHLLNKISPQKVQVDCDFFRKRKERELKEHVQSLARKVQETGENEILDFMNPYERRIVHIVANQVSGVSTESLGEGFMKRIKILVEKETTG